MLGWLLLFVPRWAEPQSDPFTFYYQGVPLWIDPTDFTPGGVRLFNRFRMSAEGSFSEFSFEAAYEHVLTLRQGDLGAGIFVGGVPGGGEWLDLQWTLAESEHLLWQHRFDRLRVGWSPTSTLQVDVGRQAMSWATTLFLTPADPFSPFDPADPFRQFRAGVDAARLRFYPSPLSEIDVVLRPTTTDVGTEMTALARGLTTFRGWELSGWGGVLYDEATGSAGVAGSLGASAIRGEAVVRKLAGELRLRGTVGFDRRFRIRGRDLFLVVEYQHDRLGAATADEYPALFESEPFRRGELQVIGRDETALQASLEIHPLWGLSGLMLWNLGDGSATVSPSFSYSASDNATVSGGFFLGLGDSTPTEDRPIPSEYGLLSVTVYLSASLFF